MNDLAIITFEKQLIELVNGVPLPNRCKWYVVKDVADKLLHASEVDVRATLEKIEAQKGESNE